MSSFRRQLVALTGALGAAVALALVAVVHVVLAGSATTAVDRVLQDRADALISSMESTDGIVRVPDARLDPGVAVYDDAERLVAGEIPPSLRAEFTGLSGAPASTSSNLGEAYRVLAQPFSTPSGASGVVVLAEPLTPYENDEHYALVVCLAAGFLIVLLAMTIAAWVSRRALRPVADMARVAEQWSHRDLERRFDLGDPTNEIRALGRTLDGLLDRVAQAILAEQRLTSELAHELRSPLTAIQATAELVEMRPDLDEELRDDVTAIRRSCAEMSATMSGLLDLARAQSTTAGRTSADLRAVLERIRRDVAGSAVVDVEVPDRVRISAAPELVRRAIEPIVHNATRLAEHVLITAEVAGPTVRIRVCDDGPGVAADVTQHLFEPGLTTGNGSGLGLALARRIARSAGGDVRLAPPSGASPAGAAFEISLPAPHDTVEQS